MAMLEKKGKDAPPFNPFVGFIILLVLGALSFLASPALVRFITTANVRLGGFIQLFPMSFPPEWTFMTQRIVVTFAIFLGFFIIFMVIWSIVMAGSGRDEFDVDLTKLRKERAQARKRH